MSDDIPPLERRVEILRDYCAGIAEDPHGRSGILGHPETVERMRRDMMVSANYLDLVLWDPDDPVFGDPAERWCEMQAKIGEWSNTDVQDGERGQ